jgi:hypothetical protein
MLGMNSRSLFALYQLHQQILLFSVEMSVKSIRYGKKYKFLLLVRLIIDIFPYFQDPTLSKMSGFYSDIVSL